MTRVSCRAGHGPAGAGPGHARARPKKQASRRARGAAGFLDIYSGNNVLVIIDSSPPPANSRRISFCSWNEESRAAQAASPLPVSDSTQYIAPSSSSAVAPFHASSWSTASSVCPSPLRLARFLARGDGLRTRPSPRRRVPKKLINI